MNEGVVQPLCLTCLGVSGMWWLRYRRAGRPRTRIVADFLIGAHAVATADRFLTRDRGFYAWYYAGVEDSEGVGPAGG